MSCINAVDGCGDHATTKPVDVSLCMGAGGQCKMESRVPEFILDMRVGTKKYI